MAVTTTRARTSLVAILCAVLVASLGWFFPSSASADPGDEAESAELMKTLAESGNAYYDIQVKLVASKKRQIEIQKTLQEAELALVRLNVEIGNIAAERYKSGQMGTLSGFLFGQGPTAELLQGAAVAEYLAWRDDDELRRYKEARDLADQQRGLLDAEIANEQQQSKELDKQMRSAEKSLIARGLVLSPGFQGSRARVAQPAERNADGSFPAQSCSVKLDAAVTGIHGCVTPRMAHALNQVRLADFDRKAIGCYRYQSWGEHPQGRACDFMVASGTATGANRTYGNELAAWLVKNANALGVLYVIWYRQIWSPGIGWHAYYLPGGSSHTDHVHLSVR